MNLIVLTVKLNGYITIINPFNFLALFKYLLPCPEDLAQFVEIPSSDDQTKNFAASPARIDSTTLPNIKRGMRLKLLTASCFRILKFSTPFFKERKKTSSWSQGSCSIKWASIFIIVRHAISTARINCTAMSTAMGGWSFPLKRLCSLGVKSN